MGITRMAGGWVDGGVEGRWVEGKKDGVGGALPIEAGEPPASLTGR